jgi:hypothetical protein
MLKTSFVDILMNYPSLAQSVPFDTFATYINLIRHLKPERTSYLLTGFAVVSTFGVLRNKWYTVLSGAL